MPFLQSVKSLFGGKLSPLDAPAYPFVDYFTQRFGLERTRQPLKYDQASLQQAYITHELVYACINKLAGVMNDAELIVEVKDKDGNWAPKDGHPLTSLFKRPNPVESGRDFRRQMVQSEQAVGLFYAEITRSAAGLPVELHPLNPVRVQPWPDFSKGTIAFYRYTRQDGQYFDILPENMMIRRRSDITSRFNGLSPLSVALKSINSDLGLTDYVDAFFESDGTPSGILKILNATIPDARKEALSQAWKKKYGRGGSNQKGVAVLDQNADYQKIGSNLNELDTDKISDRFESRVCSVFGVPPILVGAWVGLRHTTANATAKAALRDFWDNTVQGELSAFREWATWFVLPEFEGLDAIQREQVRVGWDISHVGFLQEDADGLHTRARENFKAGMWTLNEAREATGMPADEVAGSDYYVQPLNVVAVTPQLRATEADKEPEPPPATPLQLPSGEPDATVKPPKEPKKDDELDLEKKTFDYNGLTLGREPRGVELIIDLKSIVSDHDNETQKVIGVLSRFRGDLIDQATTAIEKLDPSTVYTLTLSPDPVKRKAIKKALASVYDRGRQQIIAELAAQQGGKSQKDDRGEEGNLTLDDATDALISKIINELQARAVNGYLSLTVLKTYTPEKLRQMLEDQSEKFIDQAASNVVNAVMRDGRHDEIVNNLDIIHTCQYSAILDKNTCGPCEDADGEEAATPDELPSAPNPECEGADNCRCMIIGIAD